MVRQRVLVDHHRELIKWWWRGSDGDRKQHVPTRTLSG
ncbi:hypothetical protein L916_13205 [Phytophthora nicotianae]|uniref:Uncharacterized protein n=2 Tax=Phytophthora nicotianae TaxID=4792 RepID=W2IK63_PHYNI|nr:hypothetical protein L916_13205 [Phytophthora nicotianae]ETO68296.1 hypothetical protein F444_14851 [Phytophthora nicotianae P1976]